MKENEKRMEKRKKKNDVERLALLSRFAFQVNTDSAMIKPQNQRKIFTAENRL